MNSCLTVARRPERGFSIVELMVAMVISLVLFAGALSLYFNSKTTYTDNERVSRLQETGRITLDLLTRDIRATGYLGCNRGIPEIESSLNNPDDLLWDFQRPIVGYDGGLDEDGVPIWTAGGGISDLDTDLVTSIAPGNDIIALRVPARQAPPFELADLMADDSAVLTIEDPYPATNLPNAGDIFLVTDCVGAAVFQATAVNGNELQHDVAGDSPGNVRANLGYTFQSGAELVPILTNVYYIGSSESDDTVPSLWRRVGAANPEELLQGVEALQIVYGVDTTGDGTIDFYRTASAVDDWQEVIAVRIGVLVRTPAENNLDLDTRTYDVLGLTYDPDPDDRRQRMVLTTTVTLRNRTP